jgi:hypothetical protein
MRPQTKSTGSTDNFRVNAPQIPHYPSGGCIGGRTVIIPHSVRRLGLINPLRIDVNS